jgi:type I restriction enzyme, S subunit
LRASSTPALATEFGVLKISAVSWGRFQPSENKALLPGDRPTPRELIRKGDLLISRANTTELVGAPVLVDRDHDNLMLPDKILRLKYNESIIDPRYLLYSLRTRLARAYIEEQATGTSDSMRNLSQPKLSSIPLLLAPLSEQKRIADKLDRLFSAIDTCKVRLDAIPAILKRFRQSVLAAATSGKLTEEWRRDPTESITNVRVAGPYAHFVPGPSTWRKATFGEVCRLIGGSQPPKSTFTAQEASDVVRLIQIRDYKSDRFKVFIPRQLARRFCSSSDVMIGRYGPPIFQILRGLEGAYNVALMKAEPRSDELSREYIFYWLKRESLLRYVEAGSDRTVGQDGVRKELLHPYPFFVPPPKEQAEIVSRVDALFVYAERLEERYRNAIALVENLVPALLDKAFRGQLVSQISSHA